MKKNLNKSSFEPLYQQIIDDIKRQIKEGKLKVNSKIMTEAELSEVYNVSRITIRKAMEILAEEGVLIKKQGIGTFVAGKKMNRDLDSVMGFTESCELMGSKAGTELLGADLIQANAEVAEKLNLEGDRVVRISRLRFCDDVPVMLEQNLFSPQYAFLLGEDLNNSLHKILQDKGIFPGRCVKQISTCRAGEKEQKYLCVEENEPLLYTKDLCNDSEGNPLYISECKINASVYTLYIYLK